MCKLGDIIVIKEFKNEFGETIPQHSFVVISDQANYIEGFRYDFVSNMLCSFHNKTHKQQKLKYKENLPIKEQKIFGKRINNKTGYIKADQLYYFNKNKIEYKLIAHMDNSLLNELITLIINLQKQDLLKPIITNIEKEKITN